MHRPSVHYRTDWLPEALRQLDAIEELPDGWDSRGGGRPNPSFVAAARKLLTALLKAMDDVPKPHIHPTPSGGVQFHWESSSLYFEIEVLDADTAQYYFLDRGKPTEAEGQVKLGGPLDEIVQFACRFESV
jgi:hypothetical protein